MRILMLSPHRGVGGPIPRIVDLLVASLRELGCDVSTAPWGRHADDESRPAKLLNRPRDVLRLRRQAAALRPDCIVVQTSHDWASVMRDLALTIALDDTSSAIVLQMHGSWADRLIAPGNTLLQQATSQLLRRVAGVLVLSSEELRQFEEFHPTGRFDVVDNPFDSGVGHPASAREIGPEDEASLLFAGRLLPEKGAVDAVEAVSLLNGRRPTRLVLAGSGPAEQEIVRAAARGGISERVDLRGHLPRSALEDAYRAADVFVFPTYHPEGFPTVIAEAMSAGLPIVTTRTRGIGDHLEEGANALFIPPHEPAAVAASVDELLRDRGLRERMGRANRSAVERFAPDRVARIYVDALSKILG
jgi:glycosyltransferase involved in cell wall biosynthesis